MLSDWDHNCPYPHNFNLYFCGKVFLVFGGLKSLPQQHSLTATILQFSAFLMVQLSYQYMATGKTIALTKWTFVSKVMSLLFNRLSRFVITFLPRNKCLLISWLKLPSTVILEPKKIKCHYFHFFPIYFLLSDGTITDAMIFIFF